MNHDWLKNVINQMTHVSCHHRAIVILLSFIEFSCDLINHSTGEGVDFPQHLLMSQSRKSTSVFVKTVKKAIITLLN